MDPKDTTTRYDHISNKLNIESVDIDAGALNKIIYQADQQHSTKGWGKLVGYFSPNDKHLLIKDSFALPMPKNDERIKRDPIEDVLGYKYRHTKYNYRYVGFYIISDDKNIFTHSIVNYFLNADDIKTPKLFLYFSTEDAKMNKNPWKLYDLDDVINNRAIGTIVKETYMYDLDYQKLDEINIETDHIYKRLEFKVSKSPIFEYFNKKHECLNVNGHQNVSGYSKTDYLVSNLEDNIGQAIENLNDLLIDKKKGKTSAKINYLGAWIRHRELMEDKESCLEDLRKKIEVIKSMAK